jgi:hypothetical protein
MSEATSPPYILSSGRIFEGRDGQVVLVAREDYFGNDLTRTYPIPVIFVDISPDTTSRVTRLLVDWDFYHTGLNFATIAGGQLLFSTTVCCGNETATSLFSFPINRFGAQRVRPTTIYSQLRAAGADILSYASQSFGPTLFAYISAGDLHARAYDGSIDLVLEHQVTYMDNPSLHHPGDDRLH